MKLDEMLDQLGWIALYKSMLPWSLRGWVNALDLHVQERKAGTVTRMQAGGKFRKYLDAWQEQEGQWKVKRFDRDVWDRRFSQVVEPTLEIADYLMTCTSGQEDVDATTLQALEFAVAQFNSTGVWPGLPIQEVRQEQDKQMLLQEFRELGKRLEADREDMGAWEAIGLLYVMDKRPKDAEQAFREAIRIVTTRAINPIRNFRYLGRLYLEALGNAVAQIDIPIKYDRAYALPNLTPDDLGYTVEQLRTLSSEYLNRALSAMHEDDIGYLETKFALDAAREPTGAAFRVFKDWLAQQWPGFGTRASNE